MIDHIYTMYFMSPITVCNMTPYDLKFEVANAHNEKSTVLPHAASVISVGLLPFFTRQCLLTHKNMRKNKQTNKQDGRLGEVDQRQGQ